MESIHHSLDETGISKCAGGGGQYPRGAVTEGHDDDHGFHPAKGQASCKHRRRKTRAPLAAARTIPVLRGTLKCPLRRRQGTVLI